LGGPLQLLVGKKHDDVIGMYMFPPIDKLCLFDMIVDHPANRHVELLLAA
jgi:hypothetical protein